MFIPVENVFKSFHADVRFPDRNETKLVWTNMCENGGPASQSICLLALCGEKPMTAKSLQPSKWEQIQIHIVSECSLL